MNALRFLIAAGSLLLIDKLALPGQVKDDQVQAAEKYLRDGGIPLDDKTLIKLIADFTGPGRGPEKIQAFIKDLDSPVFKKRKEAKQGLVKMGTRAVPYLRKLKDSPDPEISRWVKKALEEIDIRSGRYVSAVRLLAKRGTREAMPVLWDALEDPDSRVIHTAEEGLADLLGPKGLPLVAKALKDQRIGVRASAVRLLWHYQPRESKEVAALALEVLRNDKSVAVRQRAVECLGIVTKEKGVIEAMLAALEDQEMSEHGTVATWAAVALGTAGVKRAVPRLLEFAQSPTEVLAVHALRGLHLMLDNYQSLIPEILPVCQKLVFDKKKPIKTRASAVSCLGRMDERAVPVLIKGLNSDSELRGQTLSSLQNLGPKSRQAVPHIIRVLVDPKETREHRRAAAQTLGEIGPAAQDAVPVLERGFDEPILDELAKIAAKKINKKH